MTDEAQIMESRYQRAKTLLQGMHCGSLVKNDIIFPHWIDQSTTFWYERDLIIGKEYRLVDADTKSNELAFDHSELAKALRNAVNKDINSHNLPLKNVEIKISPRRIFFSAFDRRWMFDCNSGRCEEVNEWPEHWVISPDGNQALFRRDFNVWLRDLTSGEEWALTQDGVEDFAYAIDGENYGHSVDRWGVRAQASWSPDGHRIFTLLRDTRQVKSLPVVQHVPLDGTIRPKVSHYKIAFTEDTQVPEYHLMAIEVATGIVKKAHYPSIPVLNNSVGYFNIGMGWWSMDSRRAYFVDQARDYKTVKVIEFDTNTGETRVLFTEISTTNVSLSPSVFDHPTFIPLPASSELIWWSERTGWGHLYLYDLETGKLKHALTQGKWLVREVLEVDVERRELFVQTTGRTPGRDPYYKDLCRLHIDNCNLTTLVSSDHEYFVASKSQQTVRDAKLLGFDTDTTAGISHNYDFVVVTRSRADEVPVSLLIDRDGNELLSIETADVSNLPVGWQWPEPVKLEAADGKTDIYGLVYRPSDFSPEGSYPVLACGYYCEAGPIVPKGSFSNGSSVLGLFYFHAIALAELGFIVIQIDGRGTPYRDKAFMDDSYGWTRIASNLEDEIAGIRQLAEKYPYMDLDRVGIICPPVGPGAVWALLKHPEFYKVGVTGGHYDNRLTPSMIGDKCNGVLEPVMLQEFPEHLVENLQGKLLLMGGMLDPGNPIACTLRLVNALQSANKDFDMILLPQSHHGASNYQIRRAWDYLVRHLLGKEPPKEFQLIAENDLSELFLNIDTKAS